MKTENVATDLATPDPTRATTRSSKARKKKRVFPRTDSGNAELFAHLYADTVRYDHRRKRWLIWRKHWWAEDVNGGVYQLAKEAARYRLGCAADIGNDDERQKEAAWAVQSESRHRLEATLKLAQSEPLLTDDGANWDADPWLLGVKNGVVDLRTGMLRAGKPQDRITMHTNVAFDPKAKCPRFEKSLQEIFDDNQELIDYVHRATGYSATGSTEEQSMFDCFGEGSNGKTTLLETIKHTLGDYAYALPFSAFEKRARSPIPNDLAASVGRRFILAAETDEEAALNAPRVKVMTGGDTGSARFLYGELFNFNSTAKIWLAFNQKPRITDASYAMWRRVRLIPFNSKFEGTKDDKKLKNRLKAEARGILAWIVRGCLEWQERGLHPPAVVAEATEVYRRESDPVGEFIRDSCFIAPHAWVSLADLWEGYERWRRENPEYAPLDRSSFTQRLEAKGFKKSKKRMGTIRAWIGIDLKSNPGGR